MTTETTSLREVLEEVRRDYGRLTPSIVLQAASERGNPYGLHDRFDWDDASAAERHRLRQARDLIASCRIRYVEATERQGPRSVRAFHSMPDALGRAYDPAVEVAQDPMARKILLAEMERDFKALKRRWGQFKEFAEMIRRDLGGEAA